MPVTVAVAGGADLTVLQALRTATDWSWIVSTVTAKEAEIRELAGSNEISLADSRIIDSRQLAAAAVREVK